MGRSWKGRERMGGTERDEKEWEATGRSDNGKELGQERIRRNWKERENGKELE